MIHTSKIIRQYRNQLVANGLNITRRGIPDGKPIFTYSELEKTLWNDVFKEAMKYFQISFDLENNDPDSSELPKIIRICRPSTDKVQRGKQIPMDEFTVSCQLWFAGGDWEYPSMYFKCQLIEDSFYGLGSMKTYRGDFSSYGKPHIILIPPPSAGNSNLIPGKNGLVAIQDNGLKSRELDKGKAWKWLEDYFMKTVMDHIAGKNRPLSQPITAPAESKEVFGERLPLYDAIKAAKRVVENIAHKFNVDYKELVRTMWEKAQ